MKNVSMLRLYAFLIAGFVSGLFLYFVLKKPSAFNMLPFSIHEAINPGGSSETTFIIVFDIVVALLLLLISYKIAYKLLNKA